MNRDIKITIIIGCILTFLVVPAGAIFIFSKNTSNQSSTPSRQQDTTTTTRTNEELADAVASSDPLLAPDGNKRFIVTEAKKVGDTWYIATIQMKDDSSGGNTARVLINDARGHLSVILGPGTLFDEENAAELGVPSSVFEELNK